MPKYGLDYEWKGIVVKLRWIQDTVPRMPRDFATATITTADRILTEEELVEIRYTLNKYHHATEDTE